MRRWGRWGTGPRCPPPRPQPQSPPWRPWAEQPPRSKKMGKIKEKKKIQGPVPSYYFIKAACFLSDVVALIII